MYHWCFHLTQDSGRRGSACKDGNIRTGCIKGGEFIEYMFLNKDFTPGSYFKLFTQNIRN